MSDGFRVGGAFIDVDIDADAAVAKLRRQLKSAKGPLSLIADEIGNDFGKRLGNSIERNLKQAKGRISSVATGIGNDAGSKIVSNMDKQLKGAKGRLGKSASEIGSTIGAKVSTALSKDLGGKLDATLGDKATKVGVQLGESLGDGVDEGASVSIKRSPKVKSALDSVANRSQAQFKGLVFAGAFAGLPVAAGAAAALTIGALAAVPLALVAGAAKIQSSNEDVAQSYTRLAGTAVGVMTRASSVLVKDLVAGTDRLTAGMAKLEPAMTGAFKLAAPAVDGIVSSVLILTNEALPGVITGLTKTSVVMKGVEELARGTGRGVSDFFTNISTGSASAATNMGTLGRMIQDLLGAAGQLVANLSNGARTVLPMFANALSGVYSVLLNLTSNGMGPLSAAVGGFITVMSGVIAVVQGVSSAMGGWLSPLAAVAGGLLAINMISNGAVFSTLKAQFTGLGSSISAATGPVGKFKAAVSGIGAGLFSPATLGITALVIGLGLLGMAQQAAAQKAAEHKARVGDLSAALRDSNGAVNENVRALGAKALADIKVSSSSKSVLESARELGVSLPTLTSAYLGNADAQRTVNDELQKRANIAGDKVMAGEKATEQERAEALAVTALQQELKGTNTEYGKAVQQNKDLAAASATTAAAVGTMTPTLAATKQGAGELASAFTALYSPMTSVADRGNALIAILDRLSGRTPSYEESIQGLNDTLRTFADSLAAGMDHTKGWGDALLNADGTVSTFTENGSNLQNTLVQLQSGFANAGASIQELVKGGMSYTAASAQVQSALQTERDRFIESATAMLGSRDAAEALADKYGLLPAQVVTTVTDAGSAVATQKDVEGVMSRLVGLPPNTPVRVTSITAEAEQNLANLGYTVTHMPDGTVTIFGNGGPAMAAADAVESRVQAIRDKTVTITVQEIRTAQSYSASVGGIGGQATGGYQFPASRFGGPRTRASGGPTPYRSGMEGATWTGERGPELSFPSRTAYIATNQQTQAFERRAKSGELALERNITIASPNPAVAPNISVTVNVYPPPSMDVDALTEKITRKIERALKGGSS